MKVIHWLKRKIDASIVSNAIKRDRRKRGLSTDLKVLIEKYRTVSPEYAEKLERLIYPS